MKEDDKERVSVKQYFWSEQFGSVKMQSKLLYCCSIFSLLVQGLCVDRLCLVFEGCAYFKQGATIIILIRSSKITLTVPEVSNVKEWSWMNSLTFCLVLHHKTQCLGFSCFQELRCGVECILSQSHSWSGVIQNCPEDSIYRWVRISNVALIYWHVEYLHYFLFIDQAKVRKLTIKLLAKLDYA